MITFIITALIISSVSSFIVSLAYKTGVIQWMQCYGSDIISEMARCNFCLSWWTCVIISIPAAIMMREPSILLCPFVSTSLAKNMI